MRTVLQAKSLYLQEFCKLQKPLENHRTAFTRQRSLVRTQHRPHAKILSFDELAEADLIVDAIYLGGEANNAGDDPLNKLTQCGNIGDSGR